METVYVTPVLQAEPRTPLLPPALGPRSAGADDVPPHLRAPPSPPRGIDVKNAKSTGVSVFETLFETPKPGVSAF